jgi:hypothetical protein
MSLRPLFSKLISENRIQFCKITYYTTLQYFVSFCFPENQANACLSLAIVNTEHPKYGQMINLLVGNLCGSKRSGIGYCHNCQMPYHRRKRFLRFTILEDLQAV